MSITLGEVAVLKLELDSVKSHLKSVERERDFYHSIILETLKTLPVGYIPYHKPENIPSLVEDWVKRAVKAEEDLDKMDNLLDSYADVLQNYSEQ